MQDFFSDTPLNVQTLRSAVRDEGAGAVLVFEGTVRNHSAAGTGVIALVYEAKQPMADKIIARIITETQTEFSIAQVAVKHRLGKCELGEPTIVIAVSAAHRDEAYLASRKLIDRIKHEVPIWKQEIFSNGNTQWSEGCEACTPSSKQPS